MAKIAVADPDLEADFAAQTKLYVRLLQWIKLGDMSTAPSPLSPFAAISLPAN